MIEVEYIIAFAMAIVNLFKKYLPAAAVPIVSLGAVVLCNVLNAWIFGGQILPAGKEAFIAGGICIGLFTSGDVIRRAPNHLKTERDTN